MAFSSYYSTPSLNVSINGISIAENCPAANINDAIRQLMADARLFNDSIPNVSNLMPLAGGVFTGPVTFTGKGQFLYHNDPSNASGKLTVQAAGGAWSPSNGDILAEW